MGPRGEDQTRRRLGKDQEATLSTNNITHTRHRLLSRADSTAPDQAYDLQDDVCSNSNADTNPSMLP